MALPVIEESSYLDDMITKGYLLHVVDGLVEDVERPVRRGERGEDGAPQLQAARPDLQRALKHLHSVVVLALKWLTFSRFVVFYLFILLLHTCASSSWPMTLMITKGLLSSFIIWSWQYVGSSEAVGRKSKVLVTDILI